MLLTLLLPGLICIATAVGSKVAAALQAAPNNQWVLLRDFPDSGARAQPAFFYSPTLHKFILTGGAPGGSYGQSPRHYDSEEFDLKSASWINAYPQGAPETYAPPSGTTHAPETLRDDAARTFRKDKAGFLRIPFWSSYGAGRRPPSCESPQTAMVEVAQFGVSRPTLEDLQVDVLQDLLREGTIATATALRPAEGFGVQLLQLIT